jgi:glycosyltransferase involved in cell wall biosynthesis
MPARPLHLAWRRFDTPPVEWFVGSVDVVHGTNFVVPPTRRAGRVVTVHDLTVVHHPELCDPPTLAYPALIRRALRAGAFVHTPSAFVAAEVVEAFGAPPERVRAVHSGVPERPAGATGEVPADLLPTGAGRYILSLATSEPRKDLPSLVTAFDQLAEERADVALVLAGPPGWGETELAEALARSGHAKRIVRPGWLPDATLALLLERASVLAYPSRYEGFGFPALEAMDRGIPVVATSAGALPEVLGDGAALVPVGNADALAEALASVLDSPAKSEALARAGRRRAALFSWAACAEGLSSLYRDVAAEVSEATPR